jgi:formylglycine-generating enzyme required for sulfatase activity
LLKFEDGQYNFRHLNFQEFLAAVYIVDNFTDYGKAIEMYWNDERYSEVIDLYIGYLSIDNKRWANQIIQDVLNKEDSDSFHRWRLAARSILDVHEKRREIEVVDLAAEKLRKIIQSQAAPKALADAGEILGRLGDRRDLELFTGVKGGTYGFENRTVQINPFEISKYQVTNQWYAKFVEDHGYKNRKLWSDQGKQWLDYNQARHPRFWSERRWNCPNSPVVGVSWYESCAFANWLTVKKKDGFTYSLPDENQWEASAAGFENREYPWGSEWEDSRCNTHESKIGKTSSVGIFTKGDTPEGISDLAGNVWEWTKTDYHSKNPLTDFRFDVDLQKLLDDEKIDELISKLEEKDRRLPVLRGGSWDFNRYFARCADRSWSSPSYRYFDVGFRCVRTLT